VRVTVIGLGAVGSRVVDTLAADPSVESITVVHRDPGLVVSRPTAWGDKVQVRKGSPGQRLEAGADVVVVAGPAAVRRSTVSALESGAHVVCPVDDPIDLRQLLELDPRARAAARTVAIGTAMAPGLSCLLARRLARSFDSVEEIHVASLGTGGPECARRHHDALAGIAVDWADGTWRRRAGGSGRELVWFPEPVGGADCYRAALGDPLVLAPAFPGSRRITSRMAATRRDRLTSWLPMMRAPHPEGLVGAVRVEMRGWIDGRPETRILGSATAPAVAAAAVTAAVTRWAGQGRLERTGTAGLAELVGDPGAFLTELAGVGVAVAAFEGGGE
jgi:saccharopine dehydrogenase-like NADP-dependent oxidoreductase